MSIYEYIITHITGGRLPDDFSLPQEEEQGLLHFADGAMDGISIYHIAGGSPGDEVEGELEQLLGLISHKQFEEAERQFMQFAEKNRALNTIDTLQNYIIMNKEKISEQDLYIFGYHQIFFSPHIELVKYGLAIMEIFNEPDDEVKKAIRLLGMSDEFTIFAIFNMKAWENSNNEIFELAKKVHGWGRIHALEYLQPETDEIKEWILHEGMKNHIMPEYSALTCFVKADAASLLKSELTAVQYQSIGSIIQAMLNEGPVAGISFLDNSSEMLCDYLEASKLQESSIRDYDLISSISEYAESLECPDERIISLCHDLI